jgi:hypothetical protein
MTPSQRRHYHSRLWPDACKAQGWDKKDEEKRREVTEAATGKASSSALNQGQITLLFNKLKWLADPVNFDRAFADANPDLALEEDKRSRIIWRIEHTAAKKGFNEAWLHSISEHKCTHHNVKVWRQLPTTELLKLSMTVDARKKHAEPRQDECADDALAGIDMPF